MNLSMLPVSVHGRGRGWFFLVFFVLVKLLSFRAAAPPLSGLSFKMKKTPAGGMPTEVAEGISGIEKVSPKVGLVHKRRVLVQVVFR